MLEIERIAKVKKRWFSRCAIKRIEYLRLASISHRMASRVALVSRDVFYEIPTNTAEDPIENNLPFTKAWIRGRFGPL
jgi:hypothetical protein